MKPFLVLFFFFLSVQFSSQMLTSVYFENNSFDLSPGSKKKLDSLSQLKSNLTFRIFGNANPLGSAELNKKLSENRAMSVSEYLKVKMGKNVKLGNSVGLGEGKQINDNSTEALLAKNRRVDIFIEKQFLPGEKISKKNFPSFFDVKVNEMKVKDTFLLPEINFIGGRHVWLPKADSKLLRLYEILKTNPRMTVELQGHICCEYEDFDGLDLDLGTYNLSVNRAKTVQDYLIKKGISAQRIKSVGLGHLNPLVYPEINDLDRTKNRRVEVMLRAK
ncbi:MAG: OmpA family protein [Weeksellaceae bacterium]|nr:OmpA family protein [Weeksellaceae bacterium]